MTKHYDRLLKGPRKPLKDPALEAKIQQMWEEAKTTATNLAVERTLHEQAKGLIAVLATLGVEARFEGRFPPQGVYVKRPGRPEDPEAYVVPRGIWEVNSEFRVFAYRCPPKTIEGIEATAAWLAKPPYRRK